MTRSFRVLLTVLTIGAVALLWFLAARDTPISLTLRDIVGVFTFFIVGLFAQAAAIDFGTGRPAKSSMVFLPFMAGAIVFAPTVAVLIACLVIALADARLKRPLFLTLFNLSATAIAVGVGSLAYQSISIPSIDPYPNFLALALVFFGSNILLTSIGIAAFRDVKWGPVLREASGPLGGNLLYDLLASPLAFLAAFLYGEHGPFGVLIIALPALLLRMMYESRLRLEQANIDILTVLVKAIETRDPYTSGHSIRVASLARSIAQDLGLPHTKIVTVEKAGLLHDIGKIHAVYADVISKPHNLTEDERALIRTHAEKGATLLESLRSVPNDIISAVRHHHERFDGTGYPSNLLGEDIPLPARIIMLCDSIDAMLSDRPYRKALDIKTVESELLRCAGSQFDPAIVKVVLARKTIERATRLVASSLANPDQEPVVHWEAAASA